MLRAANATLPIAFVLDHGFKTKGGDFRETISETTPNLRVVEAQKLQSFLQSIDGYHTTSVLMVMLAICRGFKIALSMPRRKTWRYKPLRRRI